MIVIEENRDAITTYGREALLRLHDQMVHHLHHSRQDTRRNDSRYGVAGIVDRIERRQHRPARFGLPHQA